MVHDLLLYRCDPAARAAMPEPTPEQSQEMAAAWLGWRDGIGAASVDFGDPTVPVSPGAYPTVGGYCLIEAEGTDEALALLAGHPHTAMGGTVDVYEVAAFPLG